MMEASKQPSPKVTEVLGRALVDDDFRKRLYEDRTAAVTEYGLTASDEQVLSNIPAEMFEQQATAFREGSVVGAAVAIGIGARGHFATEEPGSEPEA
jgi:hypothetical protein